MNSPICKIFEPSLRYKQKAVRAVHYNGISLVIDIQGERKFSFVRVIFERPIGFRVLDEHDLNEFWKSYNEQNGWLYEVSEGGWLELESKREGFFSKELLANQVKEYLLVDNKCISVLSVTPPTIEDLGTDPKDASY